MTRRKSRGGLHSVPSCSPTQSDTVGSQESSMQKPSATGATLHVVRSSNPVQSPTPVLQERCQHQP